MQSGSIEHELNQIKKIVAEFVSRLEYEAEQFKIKFNDQIDLILVKAEQQTSNDRNTINTNDLMNAGYIKSLLSLEDEKARQIFIYPKDAAKLLGVGTTKFYQLNKLPDFPKPRNPLGKRVMYIRSEVEDWAINLGSNPKIYV